MSTVPAESRGGDGKPLTILKTRKGLTKAPVTSVVGDMIADPVEEATPPVFVVAPAVEAPDPAQETQVPFPAPVPDGNLAAAQTGKSPRKRASAPRVDDKDDDDAGGEEQIAAQPAPPVAAALVPDLVAPATPEKQKIGFWLPVDVMQRLRNAYGPTSRLEGHRSLSGMVSDALEAEARRLEEKYNDGERFPDDEIGIPRGRPLK